ncbi:MAG: hypothetical protein JW864_15190 [Spirochaetes bacterium]|nr:hypothetical protein [Spirochaetota bacterium]
MKYPKIIIAFILISGIVSCSTGYNKLMRESEIAFYKGNYVQGAKKLLPYVNNEDNNQLIFLMECGMMLHAAGEYEKSNKILMGAAKLADNIAVSISKQTAALLLNETKTNYKGEDFERVLIHMYIGINFLMLNDADSARVSFKKVNDLLRDINVTTGKSYKQNLMAKYLTAIAFELSAQLDNDDNDREFAYIEYKQINNLDPGLQLVYADLQRLSKDLGDNEDYDKWVQKYGQQDNSPVNAGELVVIFQAGQGAIKVSRGHLLNDVKMKNGINVSVRKIPVKAGVTVAGVFIALKIAEHPIPQFRKRSNKIDHLVINVNGRDIAKTILLEDVENTAVKNMQDNYSRMYAKVAAGIAAKAVASLAVGVGAKKIAEQSKKLGGVAGLIGVIAGAGTGTALASQIKPDLRNWHTLPANLQIGRVFLRPGKYDIVVKYMGKNGQIYKTDKESIEIKKDRKTFLNYRSLY